MKCQAFKTSVNIKFDFGKKEFIERYLPTPSHAESLIGLLDGFLGQGNKSHIIVGPYGTGKSLIATIVANVVSKKMNKKDSVLLLNKFNKVHDEIFTKLREVQTLKIKYIAVPLTGNEGNFRKALLTAINRELYKNKIDIVMPGHVGKILDILLLWESEYKETYKKFLKLLKEYEKDIEVWRIAIINGDLGEIDWFTRIYPTLTSGSIFTLELKDSFIEQIEYVMNELGKKNIGLFITYDEFGRFLQSLESGEINQTMQDLQDIAELASHSKESLHILLISHKNLSQYMLLQEEEYRNEFQRIEKRFRYYYVKSDKGAFFRITENYLQGLEIKENLNVFQYSEQINMIRKYQLFPELNQTEIEKIIINGIYPIHPLTLFLLPQLSGNFGQNERTLFTFLESNETGGLRNHLDKSNEYYRPAFLFNYFFPSSNSIEEAEDLHNILKMYRKAIAKHQELFINKKALEVLKIVTLWNLADAQSQVKLNTELISFATLITESKLDEILKILTDEKVIRFNRVIGAWELFEGSSFILDDLKEKALLNVNVSMDNRIKLLHRLLVKKFFLANEYNDEKNMTRFAGIKFITSSVVEQNELDINHDLQERNADALVYYIIIEHRSSEKKLKEILQTYRNNRAIFALSPSSLFEYENHLKDLLLINHLLMDQDILTQDVSLKRELEWQKEELIYHITKYINSYTSYNKNIEWFHNGLSINIESEIQLEKLLSDIFFMDFPLTPEIRNDSFNRRKINNVQYKAAITVLNGILTSFDKPQLGINGQGPDYLIYATIFKNNKFNVDHLNAIQDINLFQLRQQLLKLLESNPTGNLNLLIELMKSQPFGIRDPIIPILLVALIRDKWEQLMFYRNEMFITGVNAEIIYKMVNQAEEYKYEFLNYSAEFEDYLNNLESLISPYINDLTKGRTKLIKVCNGLLTWLRNLPKITQITTNQEIELLGFKEIIRRSEIDPLKSIQLLFEKYGNNTSYIQKCMTQLEQHFESYKNSITNYLLINCSFSDIYELIFWLNHLKAVQRKNNRLAKYLLQANSNNLIEDFCFNYTGVKLVNWSDKTYDLFINQIQTDISSLKAVVQPIDNSIEIVYSGISKSISQVELSTKSETIYNNVSRMIKNAGRNVPKEEIEVLIFRLLNEFIE
jgi:hypothetical protein